MKSLSKIIQWFVSIVGYAVRAHCSVLTNQFDVLSVLRVWLQNFQQLIQFDSNIQLLGTKYRLLCIQRNEWSTAIIGHSGTAYGAVSRVSDGLRFYINHRLYPLSPHDFYSHENVVHQRIIAFHSLWMHSIVRHRPKKNLLINRCIEQILHAHTHTRLILEQWFTELFTKLWRPNAKIAMWNSKFLCYLSE